MPIGPQIQMLKASGSTPELTYKIAKLMSYKFLRRDWRRRVELFRMPQFEKMLAEALDSLEFTSRTTRKPREARFDMRYPVKGMNLSAIAEQINQRFWREGWGIAVGSVTVRKLLTAYLKKKALTRAFKPAPHVLDYDDVGDAAATVNIRPSELAPEQSS